MATLAEIRNNPAAYLGEGGEPGEYEAFIHAVEALIARGMNEQDAIGVVWNDGEWYGKAIAIVEDDDR
jgi:hypothetical protein